MEDDIREPKKIDFKEKAIKAKEASIKKTIKKAAGKSASGSGPGGNNQNNKKKESDAFYKNLLKI